MKESNGAIAVFVKTPGLSEVKTRLAGAIGREAAIEFHVKSAKAIESVVKQACQRNLNLTPFWAVAETEGRNHQLWKSFRSCSQGGGSLGERLCHVYSYLISHYNFVLFLGADSPQITSDIIIEAATKLSSGDSESKFTIGPAEDGGFYLFGGSIKVPERVWLETPYSVSNTTTVLKSELQKLGKIHLLAPLFDVDNINDAKKLSQIFSSRTDLTSEQAALKIWLKEKLSTLGSG